MSSGRRPAVCAEEGFAPSEDQSALKLVVADDADEGLDKSIFVELCARTLLTDRVVGLDEEEGVIRCRWDGDG